MRPDNEAPGVISFSVVFEVKLTDHSGTIFSDFFRESILPFKGRCMK